MGEGGRGPSPGSFLNKLFSINMITPQKIFVNIPNIKILKNIRNEIKKEGGRLSGNDLLSHPVARAVPSALEGLASVFGMGTGVSPPL